MSDAERRQMAYASRPPAPPPKPGDRPRLLCDGGSRGNPGPAAIAAVLLGPGGDVFERRAELIGHATAAEAEYRAILLGLRIGAGGGTGAIEVCSDSKLAIGAVRGDVPADPALAALVGEIHVAARAFSAVRWTWHPRGDNAAADELVRELLWP
jgi:ribonuclease HI